MKPPVTAFTAIYTEWLGAFRALIPGGSRAGPASELTPKQAQAAANQEWEDEGGRIKPEKMTEEPPAAKIPL